MDTLALEPPSLSCRTSPPQGGRLDVAEAFANQQRWRGGAALKLLISPLAGEMSGGTEGGVKELDISSFGVAALA
ncbi:hypothetical protein FJ414_09720 [Mesorhizobium sp. B3-1-6]|nr:hypothetical protein FJ414_09720 [Mesorhizobium sp. B3-1-6]